MIFYLHPHHLFRGRSDLFDQQGAQFGPTGGNTFLQLDHCLHTHIGQGDLLYAPQAIIAQRIKINGSLTYRVGIYPPGGQQTLPVVRPQLDVLKNTGVVKPNPDGYFVGWTFFRKIKAD